MLIIYRTEGEETARRHVSWSIGRAIRHARRTMARVAVDPTLQSVEVRTSRSNGRALFAMNNFTIAKAMAGGAS